MDPAVVELSMGVAGALVESVTYGRVKHQSHGCRWEGGRSQAWNQERLEGRRGDT